MSLRLCVLCARYTLWLASIDRAGATTVFTTDFQDYIGLNTDYSWSRISTDVIRFDTDYFGSRIFTDVIGLNTDFAVVATPFRFDTDYLVTAPP